MRTVYKIIHVLIGVALDNLFTFSPNRSTRGHVYKLYSSKSNLNVRSHFFLTTLYYSIELFIK